VLKVVEEIKQIGTKHDASAGQVTLSILASVSHGPASQAQVVGDTRHRQDSPK
jgi:hypothetical protein